MTISIIIVAAIILKIQFVLGQISGTTKCTSSSMTSCAYSQIRCPPNYYFNGQYCLPVQSATAATPTIQPDATILPVANCSSQPTRQPSTVSPTNPDPLPVKPVCERYYDWNGSQCYQRFANEPICPPGHHLIDNGECVSVVQALCQENYYLHSGFCVGLLEAPVICENDFYWDGAKCLQRVIPTCPEGFKLNNGYCERFDAGKCPSGTFMDNFKCIGHHQVEVQCEYGYRWDEGMNSCVNITNSCEDGFVLRDSVCEKYIYKSPDFECPPRTEMIGNECVSSEIVCPKGFSLIDLMCVEQISSTNETESFITANCTTGYQLVGCECVKINETTVHPPAPICPPNYVYKDGLCHYERDHYPPVCPTNFEIKDGKCVPLQPDSTENSETNCTNCKTNHTSTCACPDGYTLSNGLCILTAETSKVCPVGYELINGNCILKESSVCLPGYHFANGSCLFLPCESVCPPSTQLVNGICVITTDVGSGNCPPGYRKTEWYENCVPSENPEDNPCPTGYQWIKGICVNTHPGPENPCYNTCPQGFNWINGTCVNITVVTPIDPDTGNPAVIPVVPPINQPCNPNDPNIKCQPCPNTPCQPCPTGNTPCELCPNTPCQPCPTNSVPCQPCPKTPCQPCPTNNVPCQPCQNTPCQPCPTNNAPCQPCPNTPCQPCNNPPCNLPQPCPTNDQINPVPPNAGGCTNCPQTTHYITKDGHISITNIVNVAHHHQNRPGQQTLIHVPANIDDSFDYDTNEQNTTDIGAEAEKCCEVITPRQCKRNGDQWTCYHKKYNRCGDICTEPKIYLKPKMIHYQPPILIMPPPPRRIYGRRRFFSGGAVGEYYQKKMFKSFGFTMCKNKETGYDFHLQIIR